MNIQRWIVICFIVCCLTACQDGGQLNLPPVSGTPDFSEAEDPTVGQPDQNPGNPTVPNDKPNPPVDPETKPDPETPTPEDNNPGIQPYLTVANNPDAFFVHQDASLCGTTSFYMMFKYLGDHLTLNGMTHILQDNQLVEVDLIESIPNPRYLELTEDSLIYNYVNGQDDSSGGTNWSSLMSAARNLKHGNGAPFYEVLQSHNDNPAWNPNRDPAADPDKSDWVSKWDDDQEWTAADYNPNDLSGNNLRWHILQQDLIPFLKNNAMVMIHLKRIWYYSGHYVVVVGYDAATRELIYMDPNNPDFDPNNDNFGSADWKQALERVDVEEFVKAKWYQHGDDDARWDGKWLGFRHDHTEGD